MDKRKEIVEEYRKFSEYLKGISLDKLRDEFTREELIELNKDIRNVKLRVLPYDISELVNEMKVEEYPELLGVHNFPVLKEIDFLEEKQKIELDEDLVRFRVGNYVSNLWQIVQDQDTLTKLDEWLLEKGVIKEYFVALCPDCSHEEHLSELMSGEEKDSLIELFNQYEENDSFELYELIMNLLCHVCMECDYEFEPTKYNLDSIRFKTYKKMQMERDKSLDNV